MFENIKFGDRYRTRNGECVIFTHYNNRISKFAFIREYASKVYYVDADGTHTTEELNDDYLGEGFDIVGKLDLLSDVKRGDIFITANGTEVVYDSCVNGTYLFFSFPSSPHKYRYLRRTLCLDEPIIPKELNYFEDGTIVGKKIVM